MGMTLAPAPDLSVFNEPNPFIAQTGEIHRPQSRKILFPDVAPVPISDVPEQAAVDIPQEAAASLPFSVAASVPSMSNISPPNLAVPDIGTMTRKMAESGMLQGNEIAHPASASSPGADVYRAILHEPDEPTGQVSTEEMVQIVSQGSATIFDGRTQLEYAIGHIPKALSLAPKPDAPKSRHVGDVAEVARIVPDRNAAIIVYCNGPFCGKSRRLGQELATAGFKNVRRYQLGTPVWRALVGPMEIEPEGIRYIRKGDHTAVFLDARTPEEFATGSLAGARHVPVTQIAAAKADGRLPMDDFNTRIVTFAGVGSEALALANALARTGFNNVKFFDGTFANLLMAVRGV
ncbi:MAG TPA: rhodanese-like domain-containing protein [Candidatus Angelobacter sp.]|nr:rhodanese-like domain-containing protein [Candidatus Angelobacter sp.]